MDTRTLMNDFQSRLELKGQQGLADYLGYTQGQISQFINDPKSVTEKSVFLLVKKVKKQADKEAKEATKKALRDAIRGAIRPIVEYYPIDPEIKGRGEDWVMFKPEKQGDKQRKQLKETLRAAKGVYVFYDSQGQALYVGKTKNDLWTELDQTFNRPTSTRAKPLKLVDHGRANREFIPAHEQNRQPTKECVYFYQMASYFSAYEVAPDLINDVEALLIRSFVNSLFNTNSVKFKSQ